MKIWKEAPSCEYDDQIVLGCDAGSYLPIGAVITQFKYLGMHNQQSAEYCKVRKYLVGIYGENAIRDLEAIQCRKS